jgi:hypothetical protein
MENRSMDSMNTQHGHATWPRSIDKTSNRDMQQGHAQGYAQAHAQGKGAKTGSKGRQQEHSTWKRSMNIHHGHAA